MTARPTAAALELATIACRAGEILLRHYAAEEVEARRKEDHSPVTDADEEAEAFILQELGRAFPGVSTIAEEEVAGGRITVIGRHFFLVDPLDGTKEFINKNGEFTVNIGEIVDGRPIRGVVFAPAKNRLFLGEDASGAFELTTEPGKEPDFTQLRPIEARQPAADGLVAVASRSHRDYKTEEYLAAFPIRSS